MNIRELLARHEGRSNSLYKDSLGLYTLGIGRLIDPSMGGRLSDDEVDYLFQNDLVRAQGYARQYDWFMGLSNARQASVISLLFNLGPTKFATFKRFIWAMDNGDWKRAGDELRNSLWYKQVGMRGPEICNLIEHEVWPT